MLAPLQIRPLRFMSASLLKRFSPCRARMNKRLAATFLSTPMVRSRPRYWFIAGKRGEFSLRRLLGLLRRAFHRQRGFEFRFRHAWVSLRIVDPPQVNVRPCHHHGVQRRGVFAGGQPPEHLLGPRSILIE